MSTVANFATVAVGGAAGACARYGVFLWFGGAGARFPYGTLAANLSGALLAGFFASILLSRGINGSTLYLMLITGFLGSFTTLSAFSLDTLRLAQSGAPGLALMNLALTMAGAVVAVVFGAWLATHWSGVITP